MKNITSTVRRTYASKGFVYVLKAGVRVLCKSLMDFLRDRYYIQTRSIKTFKFQGQSYRYFCGKYGRTWFTERTVEIPIALKFVREYKGKRILEVGNVLSHYYKVEHQIVDKYEIAEGVINEDVVDFHSERKFDLIICISTLEHVGWDESPKDATKILRAINNLKSLLNEEGMILVTLPIDQNPFLDDYLRKGSLGFTKQYQLMKISPTNEWREAAWEEVKETKTSRSPISATGIVIGMIGKNISEMKTSR